MTTNSRMHLLIFSYIKSPKINDCSGGFFVANQCSCLEEGGHFVSSHGYCSYGNLNLNHSFCIC